MLLALALTAHNAPRQKKNVKGVKKMPTITRSILKLLRRKVGSLRAKRAFSLPKLKSMGLNNLETKLLPLGSLLTGITSKSTSDVQRAIHSAQWSSDLKPVVEGDSHKDIYTVNRHPGCVLTVTVVVSGLTKDPILRRNTFPFYKDERGIYGATPIKDVALRALKCTRNIYLNDKGVLFTQRGEHKLNRFVNAWVSMSFDAILEDPEALKYFRGALENWKKLRGASGIVCSFPFVYKVAKKSKWLGSPYSCNIVIDLAVI